MEELTILMKNTKAKFQVRPLHMPYIAKCRCGVKGKVIFYGTGYPAIGIQVEVGLLCESCGFKTLANDSVKAIELWNERNNVNDKKT